MASHLAGSLMELEKYLNDAVRANQFLKFRDLHPGIIVGQISKELMKHRFYWLGNETYVPNKLIAHLPVSSREKMDALKTIFGSTNFTSLLTQYISSRGFKLFDAIKIEVIESCREMSEGIIDPGCSVEFCWSIAPENFKGTEKISSVPASPVVSILSASTLSASQKN
jgi:hypothetical protein